jgi:hypothetical protein
MILNLSPVVVQNHSIFGWSVVFVVGAVEFAVAVGLFAVDGLVH